MKIGRVFGVLVWVGVLGVCFGEGTAVEFKRLSVKELMAEYAKNQDKIPQSFMITSETRMKGATNHPIASSKGKTQYKVIRSDVRCDGTRVSQRLSQWLNMDSPQESLTTDSPFYSYHFGLSDGKLTYTWGKAKKLGNLIVAKQDGTQKNEYNLSGCQEAVFMGYFSGESKRIDAVIAECRKARVRDEMDTVSGSNCYVIDATGKGGKYTIWIDPTHGYNVAKVEIVRGKGDFADGRVLDVANSKSVLTVSRFEMIEGICLPMEVSQEARVEWGDGLFSGGETHMKRTSVIFNPDHEALGSFSLAEVPDGVEAFIAGRAGAGYRWRDGKVVDDEGKEVDIKAKVEREK